MEILGGMIIPSSAATAVTEPAKALSYFLSSMAGIRIDPIAAVVAELDPDTAAKIIQEIMVTIATPPVLCPV